MAVLRLARLFLCCALLLLVRAAWPQDCTVNNYTDGPFGGPVSNTNQHESGNHTVDYLQWASCQYDGEINSGTCETIANSHSDTSDLTDTGTVTSLIYDHVGTPSDKTGTVTNFGPATVDAEGAMGVQNCLTSSCTMGVNISGSGQGGGFNVSFTNANVWSNSHYFKTTCQQKQAPQGPVPTCGSVPPPSGPPPAGCSYQFSTVTCSYSTVCQPCTSNCSPLIVDTNHTGFHLTDPQAACVLFDVTGTGVPVCVSWPQHGSGNAWLVYDADGDGIVDSGKELFGSFTPHSNADYTKHPNNENPNGFLALQWYDKPAQGGDGNLIIDKNDAIWTKLKLWIDNHCYLNPGVPCASVPGELHPLEEFGINSLSLIYTGEFGYKDSFSNDFRFSAVLNPDAETKPLDAQGRPCCEQQQHSQDGRLIYDVYLRVKK